MPTGIPHPTTPIEVRRAFQQLKRKSDVLTQGTAGQVLIGVAIGTNPVWTTSLTALTKLTVDDITIDGATIISGTGAIGFGNESLTTTGTIAGINVTSGENPGHTHTGTSLSAIDISADTNLAVTAPIIKIDDTLSLNLSSLAVAGIAAGDFVPFWDITATATNKKITFANFEATLNHDNLAGYTATKHIPAAGAAEQVLISTGAGTTAWSTAGLNELIASDGSGVVTWELKTWSRVLTEIENVYVDPAGDDGTGDGSIGSPYATMPKAIVHVSALYAGDYAINVYIAAGHYAHTAPLDFNYPFGSNVNFYGEEEDHATCALSSIDAATSVYVAGLVYFDFDVTLPVGKTTVTDDYIIFRTATGGTLPELALGVHKVIAWNAGTRVATVRAYQRSGCPSLPSGAITCDITVLATVLQFATAGISGVRAEGATHAGTWRDIALEGSEIAGSYAFHMQFGAAVVLAGRTGTSGWSSSLYAQASSYIYADATWHSKGYLNIVKARGGSLIDLNFSAILTGSRANVIYLQDGSICNCKGGLIYSSRGIFADTHSFCIISDGFLENGPAAVALYASNGAGINADSATVSGSWTATRDPIVNTGNGRGFIVGPTAAYIDDDHIYGSMYADHVSETITVTVATTEYEITAGFTTGAALSGCTFGGAHYVEVVYAGTYLINWSLSVHSDVNADILGGGFMINGTGNAAGTAHCIAGVLSESMTVSGTAIVPLAAADEISLYVVNMEDTNDIDMQHGSLTVVRLGD